MRGLLNLGIATLASLVTNSLAAPVVAHNGTNVVSTTGNTLNGTHGPAAATGSNPLSISVINKFANGVNAYITGQDSAGAVVFLAPDGTFYRPTAGGVKTPTAIAKSMALPLKGINQTTEFVIPDYISSARIWVAEGTLSFFSVSVNGATSLVEPSFANPEDPSAAVNWGFVELTNNADGIYANLSFVDFVGLLMGMSLTLSSGEVQTVHGLAAGSVASICKDLKAQTASDGQPWDEMCVTDTKGNPMRILSPNIYVGINETAMKTYYSTYVDQVWTKYTSSALTIDTQGSAGNVSCKVVNQLLTCAGDNRGYAKPTTADIFGCNSGPFASTATDNGVHLAVIPRLCAAFTRGTLLLPGGNVQPSLGSSSYYTASSTTPSNHYSQFVHKYETDGLGYAFSYDDVNPANENQAGVVSGAKPKLLQITVGGS